MGGRRPTFVFPVPALGGYEVGKECLTAEPTFPACRLSSLQAACLVFESIYLWLEKLCPNRLTQTPTWEATPRIVPEIACGEALEEVVRAI